MAKIGIFDLKSRKINGTLNIEEDGNIFIVMDEETALLSDLLNKYNGCEISVEVKNDKLEE